MVSDNSAIAVSPRALHSELMCPICLDLMRNTQTTKEVSSLQYSARNVHDSLLELVRDFPPLLDLHMHSKCMVHLASTPNPVLIIRYVCFSVGI